MREKNDESQLRNVYAIAASDPHSQLINRDKHSTSEVEHIDELMAALAALRAAEQELSAAAQKYMQLGETDMKALHFLIVARNTGEIITPGAIAAHLEISSASTTKLLDRLESGGHIRRSPHPRDRRATAISITPKTYETAVETVGRQQAQRFHAAARLSEQERTVVIAFIKDMTQEIAADPKNSPDPA